MGGGGGGYFISVSRQGGGGDISMSQSVYYFIVYVNDLNFKDKGKIAVAKYTSLTDSATLKWIENKVVVALGLCHGNYTLTGKSLVTNFQIAMTWLRRRSP